MFVFVWLASDPFRIQGQQYLSRSSVTHFFFFFSALAIFSLTAGLGIIHDHKDFFSLRLIKPSLLKFSSERPYFTYLYKA